MTEIKLCKFCNRLQGFVGGNSVWLDYKLDESYSEHEKRHGHDYQNTIISHTELN